MEVKIGSGIMYVLKRELVARPNRNSDDYPDLMSCKYGDGFCPHWKWSVVCLWHTMLARHRLEPHRAAIIVMQP